MKLEIVAITKSHSVVRFRKEIVSRRLYDKCEIRFRIRRSHGAFYALPSAEPIPSISIKRAAKPKKTNELRTNGEEEEEKKHERRRINSGFRSHVPTSFATRSRRWRGGERRVPRDFLDSTHRSSECFLAIIVAPSAALLRRPCPLSGPPLLLSECEREGKLFRIIRTVVLERVHCLLRFFFRVLAAVWQRSTARPRSLDAN